MKYTELGKSGIKVCAAPLGTLNLGTKQDRETSFALLDAYVAHGGNVIDTANVYAHWWSETGAGGESETLIGEWLAERGNRDKLVIVSKVGFEYGDVPANLTKEIIKSECEKSLKRLGIETIDLYLAHKDDPDTPQEEALIAFDELIAEGKVRVSGASNFVTHRLVSANCFARANGLAEYQVLEQRFTYLQFRRDAKAGRQVVLTRDMVDYCTSAGMSIMVYSTALGGAYLGDPECPIPDNYRNEANDERMMVLQEIASETGCNPNQIMLAWLWDQPRMMPLIAAASVEQLEENLAAMQIELSANQLARLNIAGA